ncbi:MAG: diaminopimelate epimerase [Bacteroidales bacterium]|nr:diaminopimelate epimerase [Bacteroidales bacterium]
MRFYKYHGAGNDFLVADGRAGHIELSEELIASLCDRHTGFGADGVMVLENSDKYDFRMRYYNSDGSGGMMCGNGGRCIVAFAADLGFSSFSFEAPDGPHIAELAGPVSGPFSCKPRIVRLKMKDVEGAVPYHRSDAGTDSCPAGPDDWFLDTGTRHLVRFVEDIESQDVVGEGRMLRHDSRFAPVGVNVNFVEVNASGGPDGSPADITVRTYEKGVEDETLACGTGIVASALATWIAARAGSCSEGEMPAGLLCNVRARIAALDVSFRPSLSPAGDFTADNVWLTGPAAFIGTVDFILR